MLFGLEDTSARARDLFRPGALPGLLLFLGPAAIVPWRIWLATHDVTTTSYPLWTIDNATITRLVEEGGIVAPKGPPGSILLISAWHANHQDADVSAG